MLSFRDKILLSPLWFISLFPLRILYLKSWFIYFLVYYVIRYRRKVVYNNLRRSFPDKVEKEIFRIARSYYLHLCDSIFETIHMLRMSREELTKRYKITNKEVANNLADKNKSAVILASHYANWEWASYFHHEINYKLIGIYKPLSNKLLDRLFIYIRGKYGGYPVPMSGTLRAIMDSVRQEENFMVYLVGDQRPQWSDLKKWMKFMNQDAPVITGPEKLARRFNLAALFMDVVPVRRGYYEITLRIISEESRDTKEFEITKKYIQLVEEQIKQNPAYYTWSHKRWKYKKEDFLDIK